METSRRELFCRGQCPLETERLTLRPLMASDAEDIAKYAGHHDIAAMTLRIPHPYTITNATEFITMATKACQDGKEVVFGIVPKNIGHVIGVVGMMLDFKHDTGEIGFWIGVPFQARGFATEAAKRMLTFGFIDLELCCIHGHHLSKNVGSGKVLTKIGMSHEGCLRRRVKKWGQVHDIESYSILTEEHKDNM